LKVVNIQAIVRKEFFHLIRDFRSLYLAFILPLFLILLFGYALSLDVNNIRTVAVDYDNTAVSRDFLERLDASPYFEVFARLPNTAEVNRYLDNGWTTMALIIPPKWTADLQADRDAKLQVVFDGSDPNFASISRGYMIGFVDNYNRAQFADYLERQGLGKRKAALDARVRVWFNEDLDSRNFVVPGIIAVIIMIVGAMLTSLVIAREYENGTMETIRSLPVRAGEFLIGKAVPYFVITITDVLVAILMGQVLFGIIMKSSFWLMLVATSLYVLVALTLGLLISVLTKSQLVANQIAILITYLPSLLLSDFVFPSENMPAALQIVTKIIPATYYIDILNGIYLRGVGIDFLWLDFLVLLAMFAILASLNVFRLKREGM
jgi:ABC-2 type transport system permease protein